MDGDVRGEEKKAMGSERDPVGDEKKGKYLDRYEYDQKGENVLVNGVEGTVMIPVVWGAVDHERVYLPGELAIMAEHGIKLKGK